MMLTFEEARRKVIEVTGTLRRETVREVIDLRQSCGRVLAEPVIADREYPPFDRSTRDGFAVRSADAASPGAVLRLIGEIKAGAGFDRTVGAGECVQIMTGAAVPAVADAVVMIEYARIEGDRVTLERTATPGQNFVPRGSESHAGRELLAAGLRLGYAEMALAAQVGHDPVRVARRPHVAILSTGDEVVDVRAIPGPLEIRNGNSIALEALVRLAGGVPNSLGNAPDEKGEIRRRIERGLDDDALVLSGGVSMGKYDLVEAVLADLGAEFFFDSVSIRPGKPAVFGVCKGKPVFGLPGNPLSTMVTFELFVAPAIDMLGGATPQPLMMVAARLAHPIREKGAVTHFLPARLGESGGVPEVSTLAWQGSGDVVSLTQSNAFLVVPGDRLEREAGEWVTVLPRRAPGGGQ